MTVENRGGVTTQYSYDRSNRMTKVTDSDGSLTTMLYDGDGLRRLKQTSSQRTTYVWDGSDYLGEVH